MHRKIVLILEESTSSMILFSITIRQKNVNENLTKTVKKTVNEKLIKTIVTLSDGIEGRRTTLSIY